MKLLDYLKQKGEGGFSLLELVVGVGVVLVLTVGGVLGYNGITDQARQAAVEKAAAENYTHAYGKKVKGEDPKEVEVEYNATAEDVSITVDEVEPGALRVRALHAHGQEAEKIEPMNTDGAFDGGNNTGNETGDLPIIEGSTYTVNLEMNIHPDTWWFENAGSYAGDADNFSIMKRDSRNSAADSLGSFRWEGDCAKPSTRQNLNCSIVLEGVSIDDLETVDQWHILAQKPGMVFTQKLFVEESSRDGSVVNATAESKAFDRNETSGNHRVQLFLRLNEDAVMANDGDFTLKARDHVVGTFSAYSQFCGNTDPNYETDTICAIELKDLPLDTFSTNDDLMYWTIEIENRRGPTHTGYLYFETVQDNTSQNGDRDLVLNAEFFV